MALNGVNGHGINGDGVNGDSINGDGINGNDINSNSINGHGINGNGANGTNGHGINGYGVNGHGINGHGINGDDINGNGVRGNGINGNGINGNGINGDIDHGRYTNGYRARSDEGSPSTLPSLLPHYHSVITQEVPLLLPTVYQPPSNGKEPPRQRDITENGTSRRPPWARPSDPIGSRPREAERIPRRPVPPTPTTRHAQTQTDDSHDQDSLGERVLRTLRGLHHEVLEIREVPRGNSTLFVVRSGPYGITPMIGSTDDDDDDAPILGDTPLSDRGQEPQYSNKSSRPGDTRPGTGGQEPRDLNRNVEPVDTLLPAREQDRRDSNRSFEPRLSFGVIDTPEQPRGLNLQGAIKKLEAVFRRNYSRSSEETKSSGSPSPGLRPQLSFPDLHDGATGWRGPFRRAKSRSSSDTPAILRRPGHAITRPPTPIPGRTPPPERAGLHRPLTYPGITTANTTTTTTTLIRSAAMRRRGSSPSVDYPPGPFRYPTNASPHASPRSIQTTPAKAYSTGNSTPPPPSPLTAPRLRRASHVASASPLFDMSLPESDYQLQLQPQPEPQQQQPPHAPSAGVLPQEHKESE